MRKAWRQRAKEREQLADSIQERNERWPFDIAVGEPLEPHPTRKARNLEILGRDLMRRHVRNAPVVERMRKGAKRGGAATASTKRGSGITKAEIDKADRAIKARGERVTNKTLAKELGGKNPDYIRRLRKRT